MNTWQEAVNYLDSTVQSLSNARDDVRHISSNFGEVFSDSDKERIQWEIDALSFWFSDGELQPMFTNSTRDGKEILAYPNFERFPAVAFSYFQDRANLTNNLFLKGRYLVVLWNAPNPFKRNNHGERAIDTLISILKSSQPTVKKDWLEPLQMLKVAARISDRTKNYHSDEIVQLTKTWLALSFEDDHYFKVAMIKFMAKLPKIWKPAGMQAEHDLLFNVMDIFLTKPDSFSGKEAGLLGIQLASKLGLDTKKWKNKIGEIFEAFAHHRLDDETRIVPLGQLQEAMGFYKQAGNHAKLKEVGKEYQRLQGELKLSQVQIPMNSKAAEWLWNFNQKLAEKLTNHEPAAVFGFLAMNKEIFPRSAYFKEIDKNRQPSFLDFAKKMKFDINKNLGSLNTGKQNDDFFDEYQLYIAYQVLPLLAMIFTKGILKGKINHHTLIHYLAENSWLGQELEETNSVGESQKYCWLGLLAPAILDFFVQKEAALKTQNVFTNYVLCIDSLTLKFEGVLRDFAKRLNANTIKTGRDGQIREGFTDDLLELEEIKAHFSEDDLLFFKYVFTSSGLNLRNDIAHCFFRFSAYQDSHFLLVLAAILRFAKYRVEPNS